MTIWKKLLILTLFPLFSIKAQTIDQFFLYSYNKTLFNPAAVGANEKNNFLISGKIDNWSFSDDNEYYSGVVSYDGFIKKIKSGVGIYFLGEKFAPISSYKTGISYNYKINTGESSSLRFGLRPTLTRVKSKLPELVFYDQLDPNGDPVINPSEGSSKRVSVKGDLDAGLWFQFNGLYTGISVINLLDHQHELYPGISYGSQRILNATVGREFNITFLKIDPSVQWTVKKQHSVLGIGSNFLISKIIMVGGNYFKMINSPFYNDNWSINAGINIFEKVEVLGLLYSNNIHHFKGHRHFEGMIRVKI